RDDPGESLFRAPGDPAAGRIGLWGSVGRRPRARAPDVGAGTGPSRAARGPVPGRWGRPPRRWRAPLLVARARIPAPPARGDRGLLHVESAFAPAGRTALTRAGARAALPS